MFGPLVLLDATGPGDIILPADRAFALALVLQGTPADSFRLFVPYPPQVAGAGQCSLFLVINQTRATCFIQTTGGDRAPCYAGHGNLILVDLIGNCQLLG